VCVCVCVFVSGIVFIFVADYRSPKSKKEASKAARDR